MHLKSLLQVAQLSQRDRAGGWVSYGQKWKTGTGRQYETIRGAEYYDFNVLILGAVSHLGSNQK